MSEQPQPTGRSNARMRQTVIDMVRSMAVVVAVVVVIVLFTWRPHSQGVKAVQIGPLVTYARSQAGYPIYVAKAGATGFIPTSVRWEPTTASRPDFAWHVGYLTPGNAYVQIEQSASKNPDYVAEQSGKGTAVGAVIIGGVGWEKLQAPGERSLVRITPTNTIVLSGTVDWTKLQSVAGGLSDSATS